MGVRIVSSKTFKTPVTFTEPDADGKPEKQSFVATFARLSTPELTELMKLGSDAEMCRKVLLGWDMVDENGTPVPFTPENLEAVITKPGFAGVTVLTFMESVGAVRVKNS